MYVGFQKRFHRFLVSKLALLSGLLELSTNVFLPFATVSSDTGGANPLYADGLPL